MRDHTDQFKVNELRCLWAEEHYIITTKKNPHESF